MVLGGTDSSLFEGEMKYHKLVSETYWLINVDSVNLGSTNFKNIKAVVDTGTSVIAGPARIISELTKALPSKPDCTNLR